MPYILYPDNFPGSKDNGRMIEYLYLRLSGDPLTHSRITGERKTNCGLDVPVFQRSVPELKPNETLCAECEQTLRFIVDMSQSRRFS